MKRLLLAGVSLIALSLPAHAQFQQNSPINFGPDFTKDTSNGQVWIGQIYGAKDNTTPLGKLNFLNNPIDNTTVASIDFATGGITGGVLSGTANYFSLIGGPQGTYPSLRAYSLSGEPTGWGIVAHDIGNVAFCTDVGPSCGVQIDNSFARQPDGPHPLTRATYIAGGYDDAHLPGINSASGDLITPISYYIGCQMGCTIVHNTNVEPLGYSFTAAMDLQAAQIGIMTSDNTAIDGTVANGGGTLSANCGSPVITWVSGPSGSTWGNVPQGARLYTQANGKTRGANPMGVVATAGTSGDPTHLTLTYNYGQDEFGNTNTGCVGGGTVPYIMYMSSYNPWTLQGGPKGQAARMRFLSPLTTPSMPSADTNPKGSFDTGGAESFYFQDPGLASGGVRVGVGVASGVGIGHSTKFWVGGMGLFTGGSFNPGDGTPPGTFIGYDSVNGGWIGAVYTGVTNEPFTVGINDGIINLGRTASAQNVLHGSLVANDLPSSGGGGNHLCIGVSGAGVVTKCP
jgi:hypothetical protein